MANTDLLLQGGLLLTMVEGESPIEDATVSIQGDTITHIGKKGDISSSQAAAEVIDAGSALIMPGLVNAHCHAAMTLFRGFADDMPLKQWLFDKIFPAEARHLSHDTVYWGTLLACAEMILGGITTVADGYFFQDSAVRAFHQAGMRALVGQGVIDFPAPGIPDPKDNLRMGRAFIEKWLGFSEIITPGLFCHSPTTCSDKTLLGAMKTSSEFSLPLQIHLSETLEEVDEAVKKRGERPAIYLDRLGLLCEHLIAVHAVHLDEEELALLAPRGVKIVHVPESNMKLASGIAKAGRMIEMGLTVGLGTDGCASNNNLDLFREMDFAAKAGKVFTGNPVNMDAATVLKMATSWGAKVLGLEKKIGTIEVGKKADIIIIDLDSPHMVPLYHPYSALVYSASAADVRDVIVNGKILMKDRILKTLDQEEIMARVAAISEKIAKDEGTWK